MSRFDELQYDWCKRRFRPCWDDENKDGVKVVKGSEWAIHWFMVQSYQKMEWKSDESAHVAEETSRLIAWWTLKHLLLCELTVKELLLNYQSRNCVTPVVMCSVLKCKITTTHAGYSMLPSISTLQAPITTFAYFFLLVHQIAVLGVKFVFNALTAKLFNLNFHPLEVVSRWRDPQLQVSENYSDLTKWRSTLFKHCWLVLHFIINIFKMWYLMC